MNLETLLNQHLTSEAQAEAWLRNMAAAGYGTHPDDRGADIVKAGGAPLFTASEAALYDTRMEEVFAWVADPYIVVLDALGLGS